MPRITNIDIFQKNEQPTLFVRVKTPVQNLPQLIGLNYGKMAQYLKECGMYLADIPYVAYHNMDLTNLDVEIGFPVPKALPAKDDIQAGVIPAGKYVFCIYRGPYTGMEPTYQEMGAWIEANGCKPTGLAYEHYYNGPEFPESEFLTMITMPIE